MPDPSAFPPRTEGRGRRTTRHRLPAMALATAACVAMAGCAAGASAGRTITARVTPSASPTPSSTPAIKTTPTAKPTPTALPPQSDGTLQILTYKGHAESGGAGRNWVADFESTTGCRIARLDTVQTAQDMQAEVGKRAYDVISAGPEVAARLIADGQVRPIDTAKVTGYDELIERLREQTVAGGKVYGVPYLWGVNEIIYDAAKVKPRDALALYDSQRSALPDTPLSVADAALASEVADPYELTPAQLDQAMALLDRNKHRLYWKEPITLVRAFATGKVDIALATPYFRLLLQKAHKDVRALDAPVTGWVDSWMLATNTASLDCAYRWLSWTAESATQHDAIEWVGLAPANPKACKRDVRRICEAYGVEDEEKLEKISFAVRPPGDCKPAERECTDYAAWAARWDKLVS
ncbi:extracellular solute-binding protein [Nonomuraea sp. NPDC059194]|uniref:extracellular solute-binding protein n=1 Tax=Nonomuraea sp. NPDC059194 TaxID=3346764 RepID=UPI0036884EF8